MPVDQLLLRTRLHYFFIRKCLYKAKPTTSDAGQVFRASKISMRARDFYSLLTYLIPCSKVVPPTPQKFCIDLSLISRIGSYACLGIAAIIPRGGLALFSGVVLCL